MPQRKKEKRESFPDISSRAFEHPADRAALAGLRRMTGFDTLLKKVIGALGERRLKLMFLANGVRVGPRQLPRLHRLLAEVCAVLDVPELPDLYIVPSPFLNAAAIGVDKPFIVLNSACLEPLTDEEVKCVLAHEVCHILAGHALYKTMLMVLIQMTRWLVGGPLMVLSVPILLALKEWERKAELSADQGALLVCQDVDLCIRVMMRLSGATQTEGLNVEEFENQAREYKEDGSVVDNIFKIMNLLWISHPFPTLRVLNLREWAEGDAYRDAVRGNYPKRSEDAEAELSDEVVPGAVSYKENFDKARDSLSELVRDISQAGGDAWSALSKKSRKAK
jgi:Zn-dependent protease with chaperone function